MKDLSIFGFVQSRIVDGWSGRRSLRSHLEQNGIKNPKIETVIKLDDALEVSLDELAI